MGGPTENDLLMTERARQWLEDLRYVPGAAASLSAVAKLPPPQFDAADSAALQALSVTLQRAASELQLLFAERGEVDYPYVAAAALSALRDCSGPSDLALRLDSRIRHILVDEFQDTSLDQFELLQQLTADWQSGDGRSLFLVGDPMQSIYQFRNSDVGLFLQARAAGIGELRLDALALTRNFRSDPRIVEFVNRCFTEIFPAGDDIAAGQVKFDCQICDGNNHGRNGDLHDEMSEFHRVEILKSRCK